MRGIQGLIATVFPLIAMATGVGLAQVKAPPPRATPRTNGVSSVPPKGQPTIGLPCPKPPAWSSIQIPQIRMGADYGWKWVNESAKSTAQVATSVERDMGRLNQSVKAAVGKYSDAAIRKDMKAYMEGVNQLGQCRPGAEQLAQVPVFSIRRLTQSVNVIHSMHQQARNPVHVYGMSGFKKAELSAMRSAAPVQTPGAKLATTVEVTVSNDQQSRANRILDKLLQAGAANANNNRSTTPVVITSTNRTVSTAPPKTSPGSIALRNRIQSFQSTGLTHPVSPVARRAYQPTNTQNYTHMNEFLHRSDRSLSPLGDKAELDLTFGGRKGKRSFAFEDASEENDVRPDTVLDTMQTSALLNVPVDSGGSAVRWEDITRYTDYRDLRYTPTAVACDSCDALLRRAGGRTR